MLENIAPWPNGVLYPDEAGQFLHEICESPIEYAFLRALIGRSTHLILTPDCPDWVPPRGYMAIRPQAVRRPYRLDVEICFNDWHGRQHWIDVECDGYEFHSKPEHVARDDARDQHFYSKGYSVWRYPGWLINRASGVVADEVDLAVEYMIGGVEPVLTFCKSSQERRPNLREWHAAFVAYEIAKVWLPRFGPTPDERGWGDLQDMGDWFDQNDDERV